MNKKPKPVCKESGKAKYENEEFANRGMMWIYARDPRAFFGSLHTYQCPSCKCWHIGGTKKKYS